MAFTTENTQGYSDAELEALNAELYARTAHIPLDDVEAMRAFEQAFAYEVAAR